MFDAAAARAMARKSHDLLDFMVSFKSAVIAAAQHGEFTAVVAWPEVVPSPPGPSSNAPDHLLTLLRTSGRPVWADAVRQATRAGYAVRPLWAKTDTGTGIHGLELNWADNELPTPGTEPLMLLPATAAHALSEEARAPQAWVDRVLTQIRHAAEASKLSCTLQDPLSASDPLWERRRALLVKGGYRLELRAFEVGSLVTIEW